MASTLASLVVKIQGDTANLAQAAQASQRHLASIEKASVGAGASLKRAFEVASGTLAAKAAEGILSLGKSVLGTGISFNAMKEQASIAFTTMLGSGQEAKQFLDELQAFAARTPFEFPDLIHGSQRLLAMGFTAGQVMPTLTAVGDAVAAMGGGAELIDQVTRALGQMQAKGKASAEEMLQLTEAGIPAWQNLADKIGTSVPEAMKLVSDGVVSSRTVIDAQIEGINRSFGGMMDQQSKTFSGMLSTLKDTFTQAAGQVLQPFFERASGGMERLIQLTNSPSFTAGIDEFAARLALLTDDFARGFGGTVVPAFTWIINNQAALISAATAIGVAFAWASPGGALVVGLAAALTLLGQLSSKGAQAELPQLYKRQGELMSQADALRGPLDYSYQVQPELDAVNKKIAQLEEMESQGLLGAAGNKTLQEATEAARKQLETLAPPVVKLGNEFGNLGPVVERALTYFEKLSEALKRSGEAAAQVVTELARETQAKLRSAVGAVLGAPTRETAQLELRLAQLDEFLSRADLAGGTKDKGVLAMEAERDLIQKRLATEAARVTVMEKEIQLADKSLQTNQEQISAAGELKQMVQESSQSFRELIAMTGEHVIPEMDGARQATQDLKASMIVLNDEGMQRRFIPAVDAAAAGAAKLGEAAITAATRIAAYGAISTLFPQRHSGGDIPESGLYNLKRGEHVLTAGQSARASAPMVVQLSVTVNGDVNDEDSWWRRMQEGIQQGKLNDVIRLAVGQ
ncbi:MAG TPA: tape measure protein [Dehalococcoidia bacterium]|nr:tape measure protein [Dehalococcoidia bacterium]